MPTRILATVAAAGLAAPALAQSIANFDAHPEGVIGPTFTESGITFSDLDIRFPGQSPPYLFVAEDASADLASNPNFSAPNCLGFSGYSPGPGAAYSRFGVMTMNPVDPGSLVVQAQVRVFGFGNPGNSINLVGFHQNVEIARHAISIPSGGFNSFTLEFTVPPVPPHGCDQVRLQGEGPHDLGVMFAVVDNVQMLILAPPTCYANCDESTTSPILNVADFTCFLQKFALGDPYANCDGSAVPPLLNVADFTCFLQKFAAGCG